MSRKRTFREAWRHLVRQYRLLRAQTALSRAAEKLHAAGETELAIEAYGLAILVGNKP